MKKTVFISFSIMLLACMLVMGEGQEEAKKGEKANLIIWSQFAELLPVYEAAIAAYKEVRPNVAIEVVTFTMRDAEQKLAAALPAGTGPDIYQMQLATSIQHLDYVMKLPPEMKKYRDDNILPQYILSKQNYNVDDEWGIGLWAWVNGIFVNTDMLKEAGLPIGLKYFEDIIPYAKKMTKYDGTGEITRAGISLRLSGQGSGVAQKWAMIGVFNAMHHVIVQKPDGKWREDYNNDAGRNTLQYYIDCLYKHKVNSYKIKQDTEAFGLELAAMYQRDNPVIGYMKKNAPKVNYDILQMPMLKGVEKKVMLTAVQSFYVTKISKYPQAAWAFVKYFQQPKWQEMIGIETGYEPVNKKTDRDKLYKLEPRLKSFDTSVYDKVFFEPAIPVWDEIQTKLAQRLVDAFRRQDLLDNPQGISKVISDAAEETTTILKESGFY